MTRTTHAPHPSEVGIDHDRSEFGIDPNRLYADRELSSLLRISRSQLNRLRSQGRVPRAFKPTPNRNATPGREIIQLIKQRIAERDGKAA